nr:PAS domain-containing protein [Streptococcus dysgalactiae]
MVEPTHRDIRKFTSYIKDKEGNLEGMLCINLSEIIEPSLLRHNIYLKRYFPI